MAISRRRALEYADQVVEIPRAHVLVTLRHTKGGVTLLHQRRALTKCYITRPGMRAARYMAAALGVRVPSIGESIQARVSTGVLWRAISISCLDLRKPETTPILERLLEDAERQRGAASGEAV